MGAGRMRPHMDAMSENPITPEDTKTADDAAVPVPETLPAEGVDAEAAAKPPEQKPGEIGGPKGPEPTRYGDWEFKGRCSDF